MTSIAEMGKPEVVQANRKWKLTRQEITLESYYLRNTAARDQKICLIRKLCRKDLNKRHFYKKNNF